MRHKQAVQCVTNRLFVDRLRHTLSVTHRVYAISSSPLRQQARSPAGPPSGSHAPPEAVLSEPHAQVAAAVRAVYAREQVGAQLVQAAVHQGAAVGRLVGAPDLVIKVALGVVPGAWVGAWVVGEEGGGRGEVRGVCARAWVVVGLAVK